MEIDHMLNEEQMKKLVEAKDKVVKTVKENWKPVLITATLAGITCSIMRGVASQRIERGISVLADRGISVIADRSVVKDNVFLISSRRQGAPSWVIRCIETHDIFSSQLSAAKEMELPASEISKHLNGLMDNVRGYTFERICLAA